MVGTARNGNKKEVAAVSGWMFVEGGSGPVAVLVRGLRLIVGTSSRVRAAKLSLHYHATFSTKP